MGGDSGYLVLVHLVEVNGVVLRAEELLPEFGKFQRCVCEFPAAAGSAFDAAAEHAAQDLVAETDSREAHPGSCFPEVLQQVHEFEDPGVVAVGVVHAAGDDDGADVFGDFFESWNVSWVVAVFDYEVHVCFDA